MGRRVRSVAPESLEPIGCQRRIPDRVLNVAMPHVRLQCAGIDAILGQLIAAGMAKHVRVRLDAELGRDPSALDHAREAGRRKRRASL